MVKLARSLCRAACLLLPLRSFDIYSCSSAIPDQTKVAKSIRRWDTWVTRAFLDHIPIPSGSSRRARRNDIASKRTQQELTDYFAKLEGSLSLLWRLMICQASLQRRCLVVRLRFSIPCTHIAAVLQLRRKLTRKLDNVNSSLEVRSQSKSSPECDPGLWT
jgi:hypothetical protein